MLRKERNIQTIFLSYLQKSTSKLICISYIFAWAFFPVMPYGTFNFEYPSSSSQQYSSTSSSSSTPLKHIPSLCLTACDYSQNCEPFSPFQQQFIGVTIHGEREWKRHRVARVFQANVCRDKNACFNNIDDESKIQNKKFRLYQFLQYLINNYKVHQIIYFILLQEIHFFREELHILMLNPQIAFDLMNSIMLEYLPIGRIIYIFSFLAQNVIISYELCLYLANKNQYFNIFKPRRAALALNGGICKVRRFEIHYTLTGVVQRKQSESNMKSLHSSTFISGSIGFEENILSKINI